MTPTRELRYYASTPKFLILLTFCLMLDVSCWQELQVGGNPIVDWLGVGFFSLCTLVVLVVLVLVIILYEPLLAIDSAGVASSMLLMPWVKVFVPWPEITRIGVRTRRRGALGPDFTTFQVKVRNLDHYSSPRIQRFCGSNDPPLQDVVISVP